MLVVEPTFSCFSYHVYLDRLGFHLLGNFLDTIIDYAHYTYIFIDLGGSVFLTFFGAMLIRLLPFANKRSRSWQQ